METPYDRSYIDARETLLDAAEALGPHSEAVILVGAQAIYVHTAGDADSFALSPFTYDADIALDPELLGSSPAIVDAMNRAGFRLSDQPGLYRRASGGQVDLLVPQAVGGPGRRAARLGVHGNKAAMKVHGLEGALVSHTRRKIASLVSDADRSCILKVAGPAALLVAKVHKIGERLEDPDVRRQAQLPKDAFDIYRLLRAIDTTEMAKEVGLIQSHEISGRVTSEALSMFQRLFSAPSEMGTELVVRAVPATENPDFIAASSVALSQDLLKAVAS